MTQHLGLVALVFAAVTCIVMGDTAAKLLAQAGVSPVIVAWSRFLLGAALILPLVRPRRSDWHALTDWRVLMRAALVATAIAFNLLALATEPIANVFGALFVGPIIAYGLAVILLGERPSALRTVLLLVGFGGVMLVVKPGFGLTPGMGFALLAGALYGCFLASTRALAGTYRPGFLLVSQMVIGAVLLAPMGATAPLPETASPELIALLLGSAAGSAAGNYLILVASRRGEASLIAPLIYTQLISATAIGYLAFGDWPDALTLLGLCLILLSGLATLAAGRGALPVARAPRGGTGPSST